MAWSSGGGLARVGDCSWPSPDNCEGFHAYPDEEPKATLVDCVCHWATSLVGRFLRCHSENEVHDIPLSRWTTKCWSTQRGRSVSASTWTSGEKSYLNCVWLTFSRCFIIHILVIGSASIRRYKYLFLSIYLPQSSVTSLVVSLALCSIVH